MNHRTFIARAALISLTAIASNHAWATTTDTTLTGTVKDVTGNPIPHAGVVLKSANGSDAGQTITDSAGHFALPHVRLAPTRSPCRPRVLMQRHRLQPHRRTKR